MESLPCTPSLSRISSCQVTHHSCQLFSSAGNSPGTALCLWPCWSENRVQLGFSMGARAGCGHWECGTGLRGKHGYATILRDL